MAARSLTPEEAALWLRVMANVRPAPDRPSSSPAPATAARSIAAAAAKPGSKPKAAIEARSVAEPPAPPVRRPPARVKPGETLDGSWDRKLATGTVAPDTSIDLHDHTLDSAYAALDSGLDRAIRRGDRLLLLVTGKPPRAESERPHARGRIRAAVGDWLAASRHAGNIAAVRSAHPRHGGAGALYIVLRRPRGEHKY